MGPNFPLKARNRQINQRSFWVKKISLKLFAIQLMTLSSASCVMRCVPPVFCLFLNSMEEEIVVIIYLRQRRLLLIGMEEQIVIIIYLRQRRRLLISMQEETVIIYLRQRRLLSIGMDQIV